MVCWTVVFLNFISHQAPNRYLEPIGSTAKLELVTAKIILTINVLTAFNYHLNP